MLKRDMSNYPKNCDYPGFDSDEKKVVYLVKVKLVACAERIKLVFIVRGAPWGL